ncbi:MAG: sigma-70 family RNA polymerase sigma factor [Planctomycetes bacterium]|nr:sigma-70 family RNA polymerase sigma factor [Planctomycetota bacterium]
MARNRVADWGRKQRRERAARKDERSVQAAVQGGLEPVAPDPTPSKVVSGRELLQEFRSRLTDEERRIADLRTKGGDWPQIAAELGGTPEALRKRMSRAYDRIARELKLES